MSALSPNEKSGRRPHDSVYRRLFTHRRMIEDLIRGFLLGPWVKKLDFESLEVVASHYVSDYLDQRESDVIWRVRYGPDKDDWFYVYILLELQSTVDRFMGLRLWVYMALVYQSLIKEGLVPKNRLLPPALAVVLYTGEQKWWAPTQLAELLQTVEGITPPSFEYVVLDANHLQLEKLEPITNVASGVFRLERANDLEQLKTVIEEVRQLVETEEKELDTDFALLVSSILGKLARQGENVPNVSTLMEARNMLAERAAKWTEQWLQEGLEKGRQEGMQKGRQEGMQKGRQEGMQEGRQEGMQKGLRLGMVEILKKQMKQRFGELPLWAVEQLERADVDTLEDWSSRLLEAGRLEDIFDSP